MDDPVLDATGGMRASSNMANSPRRRDFLRQGLGLALAMGAAPLLGASRFEDPDPEVPNEEIARILRELFGDRPIRRGKIELDMPTVAEDGRVVPVMIESLELPMRDDDYVKAVHLIVDHNPDPHLAAFTLTPALGHLSLQFRIKMKRTTWVRAIAETSKGEVWADYAKVAVTLNGCG